MRDDTIRHTHSNDLYFIQKRVFFKQFHHSRSKPACKVRIFDGHDEPPAAGQRDDQFAIERYYKTGVDHRCINAILYESFGRVHSRIDHRPICEYCDVTALAKDLGLSYFDLRRRSANIDTKSISARVPERRGTWVFDRRQQHIAHLGFVFGCHQDNVWVAAEVCDIHESMVCRSVGADYSGAIHGKSNIQILQADIMNDLVKGPL